MDIHTDTCMHVVPVRAGGGGFKDERSIGQKPECAYRMCARPPPLCVEETSS